MTPNRNQNPHTIILVSLLSAPFFDFFSAIVGLVPFVNGGCGGLLVSPILALIFAWFTGYLGRVGSNFLFKTQKYPVLIGLLCGFIAGVLAALIYYPDAC